MSVAKRAKWQAVLTNRKIGSAKKLLARVPEIKVEAAARRALNGQKLDTNTWSAIFKGLKLNRSDYFTDVEWFQRDLNTQWELLWNLANDAGDRFGLVLPADVQAAERPNDGLAAEKFQTAFTSRTPMLVEIPWGFPGYLILLERDALDGIILLSPSPLMANPVLTGITQRMPQYPPSPFEFIEPITIGTSYLWAGVFPKLPDLKWLADVRSKPMRLDLFHLTDLFEYISKRPQEMQMLRSSYVVTPV
jgi:hypothetical protein